MTAVCIPALPCCGWRCRVEHSFLLGLFFYLQNGGLGCVISEASDDLQSTFSGPQRRGAGLVASPDSHAPSSGSRDHVAQPLPLFQPEGKLRPQRVSDLYSIPSPSWGCILKLGGASCPLFYPDLPPGEVGGVRGGRGKDPSAADSSGDPRLPSPERWAPFRSRRKLKL